LDEAGYPDGDGFPVIKLLVNRNDIQQRIARSVARMWKQNLNVDTEVIVKDTADLEKMRKAGEFDLVRRGVVFPTSDEAANFMAIFEIKPAIPSPPSPQDPKPASGPSATDPLPALPEVKAAEPAESAILTEDDAMYELHAIPLYFPTSYSLVKPYVIGFDMNSLDAVTLSNVTINSDWQPKVR
jgi:oligopeptide transport system substrate-binding protein